MKRKNLPGGMFLIPLLIGPLLIGPLLLGTLGSISTGCGGDVMITTAVTGTWQTPMGANPPRGYSAYNATLKFAITDVTYTLTDTVSTTASSYASCQESVMATGTYVADSGKLVVVFTSGMVTRTNCAKMTDNVSRMMDAGDKALYTALVSGNFMVAGSQLTIGITVMGISDNTTYTKTM